MPFDATSEICTITIDGQDGSMSVIADFHFFEIKIIAGYVAYPPILKIFLKNGGKKEMKKMADLNLEFCFKKTIC